MFAEGQNFEGDGFGGLNQQINFNSNQKLRGIMLKRKKIIIIMMQEKQ